MGRVGGLRQQRSPRVKPHHPTVKGQVGDIQDSGACVQVSSVLDMRAFHRPGRRVFEPVLALEHAAVWNRSWAHWPSGEGRIFRSSRHRLQHRVWRAEHLRALCLVVRLEKHGYWQLNLGAHLPISAPLRTCTWRARLPNLSCNRPKSRPQLSWPGAFGCLTPGPMPAIRPNERSRKNVLARELVANSCLIKR